MQKTNLAVKIEPVELLCDPRGLLFEPVPEDLIAGQRNVHVVLSEPQVVRGNHYHQASTEVAVVVGPALVRLRENGILRDVQVPQQAALRFTLPPGVAHAFQNVGTHPMLLVCFNSRPHDRARPDTVRDVLI